MNAIDTSRISPTAHYTGQVWTRNGLSDRALATTEGAVLFSLLRPLVRVGAWTTGGLTLEAMLLQRHRVIDELVRREVESGAAGQVVEIAAGMSPRGLRFSRRYGRTHGLRYVECDLPDMAARKRRALESVSGARPGHSVVAVNALSDEGALSLSGAVTPLLDPARGVIVITEGLLNYFDAATVRGIWGRIARLMAGHPAGVYLSDLHVDSENRKVAIRIFRHLLAGFARGGIHFHFDSTADAAEALREAGFRSARLHAPREFAGVLALPAADRGSVVRIVEARTGSETADPV